MRAELLRKEQELILLKRQQIDMQIQQEKQKMQQVICTIILYNNMLIITRLDEIKMNILKCFKWNSYRASQSKEDTEMN